MRITVIIGIMICWLFSFFGSLGAQNVLGPYCRQDLYSFRFVEPDGFVVRQHLGRETVDASADFRVSCAIEDWSSSLLDRESYFVRDAGGLLWNIGQFAGQAPLRERLPEVNRPVFNSLYNRPKADEEDIVRKEWQKAFGVDVWYPYYKAKDVEDWVKGRMSVRIGKLKGEPQVERTRVFYTFKSRF